MSNYKAYPTKKTMRSRLARKNERNIVFQFNRRAKKAEKSQ